MRLTAFVLLWLASGISLAQSSIEPPAIPPSLQPALERARADLGARTGLEQATRDSIASTLDRAAIQNQEADRGLVELRNQRNAAVAQRAEIARFERRLADDTADEFRQWREQLPPQKQRDELATQLAELRTSVEQVNTDRAAVSSDLAALAARPEALAAEMTRLRQRVDATPVLDEAVVDDPEQGLLAAAAALAVAAEQRHAMIELQRLAAEQESLPQRRQWLDLRQRVLQQQSKLLDRKIDVLEATLTDRSDVELAALTQRLAQEREELLQTEPALLDAADTNIALGEELVQAVREGRATFEQGRAAQRGRTAAAESLRNTRARLQLATEDDAVGVILLSERRRLEAPEKLARELDQVRRKYAQVQLRLLDLEEQRDRLDAPERALEAALSDLESQDADVSTALREGLSRILDTRAELLPQLDAAQRQRADALRQLENALQEQLSTTRELTRLLDRQLLWIPSHEPVSLAWLGRQRTAWADLFKPSRYATSARLFAETALQRWPMAALAGVIVLVLLIFRRGIPARLEALSQPVLRVRTDRYIYSGRAFVLTALAALPWPLLLFTLGWILRNAGTAGKFSDSLGLSLMTLSGGVLLWQWLHWLTIERGLGHMHFRWTRPRRAALRAALPWLAFGLLPMQLLLTLAFVRGQEPAIDAAARLMMLAFCGLGAWLAWRLLAPGAVWTPRGVSNVEPSRLRQVLRLAIPALLAWLLLLALEGFVLTSGVILSALWRSASAILAVSILRGMLSRWILLGERRLALRRLELKREADAAGAGDRSSASGDAMPELEPEEIALESINAQTSRLLRALTIALLLVSLLWVWSDVLPALARLDEIELWKTSTLDADGVTIPQAVSLRALLVGLATLMLTFVAARNLPGLVEIGLLSRIRIDPPTRYAITSISRYVIVIGGMVAGLGLLGVRWSQLQWMAAALTVGLGFGLQEIFANFVSGLIVLFERPYRVGDIITIGEVEGTVTRIRTRATTVLDWDNKEVVVPNRTFITERFVNWTLSDAVTRVVIPVGVAYASDPARARALLLEIAEAEPMVIRQPAPTCWFVELGNSTLNFELRVFVSEVLDRNRARNALLQRIIAEFRANDIEIAFPQLDLWVRDTPAARAAGTERAATATGGGDDR